MIFNLVRPWAIISGGGRGLGKALCLHFAQAGFNIFTFGRDSAALEGLKTALTQNHVDCLVLRCDLSQAADVDLLCAKIKQLDQPQVLIHNAAERCQSFAQDLSLKALQNAWTVGVGAPVQITQTVLPEFMKHGSGCVVFVGSVFGLIGAAEHAGYAAVKFAQNGLAQSMGYEFREKGYPIRVYAFNPGGMNTRMHGPVTRDTLTTEAIAERIFKLCQEQYPWIPSGDSVAYVSQQWRGRLWFELRMLRRRLRSLCYQLIH